MRLCEVGEFGLIDIIKKDTICDASGVVMGIGDDAAVLELRKDMRQLFTADMLVEGVHFDLSTTSMRQLGRKAIAVNISDIAAMGGLPRHAAVSVAFSQTTTVENVVELYEGMKEIAREFGVNIVGGDTVSSKCGMVINVALIGEVEPAHVLYRSGARRGDLVAVTGTLGDSAAGLQMLGRDDWRQYDFAASLVQAHLTPNPQVRIGRVLGAQGATSADDVSDGLASEANEIAQASNVSIVINAESVPLSPQIHAASMLLGKPALDFALFGGEDFQLLFTVPEDKLQLLRAHLRSEFTLIGEVTGEGAGVVLTYPDARRVPLLPHGYNHFNP